MFECLVENLGDNSQTIAIWTFVELSIGFVLHLNQHEKFAFLIFILCDIFLKGADRPNTIPGSETFFALDIFYILELRLYIPIQLFLGSETWWDCDVEAEVTVVSVVEFAPIFNVAGDWIFVHKPKVNFVSINRTFDSLTGSCQQLHKIFSLQHVLDNDVMVWKYWVFFHFLLILFFFVLNFIF